MESQSQIARRQAGSVDDDGPFASGTRQRNAQRQAARNVDTQFGAGAGVKLNPDLSIGASDAFLFSGLGQSTFRVQQPIDNVFGAGNGFILDNFARDVTGNNAIYDSFFEATGVFNNGGGAFTGGSVFDGVFNIGIMPWGWANLP